MLDDSLPPNPATPHPLPHREKVVPRTGGWFPGEVGSPDARRSWRLVPRILAMKGFFSFYFLEELVPGQRDGSPERSFFYFPSWVVPRTTVFSLCFVGFCCFCYWCCCCLLLFLLFFVVFVANTYKMTHIYSYAKSKKSTESWFPGLLFQLASAHTICWSTMSEFYSMINLNCMSPGNQPAWKIEY